MSDHRHDLDESLDQLAQMIDGARTLAEAGQMVELDVLNMKIAVLTDALVAGARTGNETGANPYIAKLEQLVTALDQLEVTLRKGNVNLALDLQQADRRLRAQLAYPTPPAKT